jgi:hypothetical protein
VGGDLDLLGCTALAALPDGLHAVDGGLDLEKCTALAALPDGLHVGGVLDLYGCTALTAPPPGLHVGRTLNLVGCTALAALRPESLPPMLGRSIVSPTGTDWNTHVRRLVVEQHARRWVSIARALSSSFPPCVAVAATPVVEFPPVCRGGRDRFSLRARGREPAGRRPGPCQRSDHAPLAIAAGGGPPHGPVLPATPGLAARQTSELLTIQ